MDKRGPEKKSRLLESLDKGMTMVHVDARRPGVLVPAHLKGELHLMLNVSYRFDPPDLTVNDWGVRQTLTFQGKRFNVAVPWSALYAVSSHVSREFWMFPEDMPPELLESPEGEKERSPVVAAAEPLPQDAQAPARAVLREVVKSEPPKEPSDGPREPPRRGHLRLVK